MDNNQATTPAQAAPLATAPAVNTQPSVTEGKVTITTKEYAQLQRADARAKSFDKRMTLRQTPINRTTTVTPATPEAEALADAEARASQAEQRAMQSEVRDSVRGLLNDPKFAAIPQSTKDLILQNPQMLSNADNLEEALLDIEDRLLDIADKAEGGDRITVVAKGAEAAARPGVTATHETPPTSAGAVTTPTGGTVEDTSKLTGPARSRAVLRNAINAKRSGAQT